MAKRQFQLTEGQIKELKLHEQQTRRVAELKRLQAVRLYGSGHKLQAIMDMVGCAESSMRIWAITYTRLGLEGLLSHYEHSRQNARKLSREQEVEIRDKLHTYRPNQVLALETCCGDVVSATSAVSKCTNRAPPRGMWSILKRNSKKSDRFQAQAS